MPDRSRTALDWDDLRVVLALGRRGTLSAAARDLGVNHATVLRRLQSAEAALGKALFDRGPKGYTPTSEGEFVIAQADVMEAAANLVSDLSVSGGLTGVVRVATTPSLASLIAIRALAPMLTLAPEVSVELLVDTRVVSIAKREADVALRLGQPKDSDLVGRKIGVVRYAYYAAQEMVAAGTALERLPLIGFDDGSDIAAERDWLRQTFPGRQVVLRSNSSMVQAAAARAGYGVALLPRYMGDHDLHLAEVQLGPVLPDRELWLLTRRSVMASPSVRLVLDLLGRIDLAQPLSRTGRPEAGDL